jgi:L-asparaginase/beta-aspartyl-peptidase (threonine type)
MNELRGQPVVLVHGGAGGSKQDEDGCAQAAQAGFSRMATGADALAAATAAVVVLEDDGRFNAGSGSVLCLDGETIEMDAAVMDSQGCLGAVACLQRTKNPVLVAQAVAKTPHWLLAGEGAEKLARTVGFEPFYSVSPKARRNHQELIARIRSELPASPGVDNRDFARYWNYSLPAPLSNGAACDTVGAVARDAQGHFAVALSTGGSAPSLLGRIGDTPIIGSGFFAGPAGAVAVTGIGEHIVRHLLAYRVYQWIADGTPLSTALDRGIALFADDIDVGLIAVSATEAGTRSNRPMPVGAFDGKTNGAADNG